MLADVEAKKADAGGSSRPPGRRHAFGRGEMPIDADALSSKDPGRRRRAREELKHHHLLYSFFDRTVAPRTRRNTRGSHEPIVVNAGADDDDAVAEPRAQTPSEAFSAKIREARDAVPQ